MATYLSADLYGSGSLGEPLSGTKTFTITNYKASDGNYHVIYLTLEGNSTANSNVPIDLDFAGTFDNFIDGADERNLLVSDTKFSVSISGPSGQFEFTPTTPITGIYYIKGAGQFDLEIT